MSGPIIDGSPALWPGSVSVSSPQEARKVVAEQKEQGVDFIKVYQRLPRDAYYAILAEAAKENLPVAGHVPSSISPWEAVAAGQKTIEHLTLVQAACSSEETRISQVPVRSYAEALQLMVEASHSFDGGKCALFYEAMNGTEHGPCRHLRRSGVTGGPTTLRSQPTLRLRYFSPEVRRLIAPSPETIPADEATEKHRNVARELFAFDKKLVGEMFLAGVGILAGTDCLNPYSFPGFSLHDELLHPWSRQA